MSRVPEDARERIESAISQIQDGSPHKAEAILRDLVAEDEDGAATLGSVTAERGGPFHTHLVSNGEILATVDYICKPQKKAAIALFCAAPELLAACEALLLLAGGAIPHPSDATTSQRVLDEARDAIAKAKGGAA